MTTKSDRRDPDDGRIYVDGPGDIPDFVTDDEEREFWRTHTFSPESWEGAKRGPQSGSVRERLVKERGKARKHEAG
jgi:hypothetical protein